jgi:hypothetical protein
VRILGPIPRDIRHQTEASVGGDPDFAPRRSAQRPISVRNRVNRFRISTTADSARPPPRIYQVDFISRAHARSQSVKVIAQLQRSRSASGDAPNPAGSHQHLTAVLRIQNIGSKESSLVAAQIVRPHNLRKRSVVAIRSRPRLRLALQDCDVGILCKPLAWIRRIDDGSESAIPAQRILKCAAAGRDAGLRRAVSLRSSQHNVRVSWDAPTPKRIPSSSPGSGCCPDFGAGSSCQTDSSPCNCRYSGRITVQRPADSTIMREVAGRGAARHREGNSMLIGMHVRRRCQRPGVASVHVRQIDPSPCVQVAFGGCWPGVSVHL